MTKTEIETHKTTDAEADAADEWLDSLDSSTTPARDARHLRRIAAATAVIAEAEEEQRQAVQAARENGDSWNVIGIALGTTRQAAFQRFGQPAAAAAPATP